MQIIVLGMHRSGTSLLSGLLELSGTYFGAASDLIPTNAENPRGFKERRDIRALNDRVLHELGCDWNELSNFNKGKVSEDFQKDFESKAKSILASLQAASANGVVGIKEPRLCLLMDYWRATLAPERFFILVNRHPEEIAISLKTRNNMPREVADYLTEEYLGRAISALQTEPHFITSYSNLLSNPHAELEKMIQAVNVTGGNLLKLPDVSQINDYVEILLHRSKKSAKATISSEQLRRWYSALEKAQLPEISSFENHPAKNILAFEHENRFSEFLQLNERFRKLENQYIKLTRPTAAELIHRQFVAERVLSSQKNVGIKKSIQSVVDIQRSTVQSFIDKEEELESANELIANLNKSLGKAEQSESAAIEKTVKAEQLIEELRNETGTLRSASFEAKNETHLATEKLADTQERLAERDLHLERLNNELDSVKSVSLLSEQKIEKLSAELKVKSLESKKFNDQLKVAERQTKDKLLSLEQSLAQKQKALDDAGKHANEGVLNANMTLKANEVSQRLINASDQVDESLSLFMSSKTWWLTSKIIRLMLSPLQLGRGHTVLDELAQNRSMYRALSKKMVVIDGDANYKIFESNLFNGRQLQISIIVLNRDGVHHLERFFSSYLKHHDASLAEFVIVDHGSEDRSIEVIEKYMKVLSIKLISFDENYSFAHSNNFAVRYASGRNLVFSNNDIIFDRPAINELVSELSDPAVGLVGLPLFYADEHGNNSGNLQHGGISFRMDEQFDFARPVNVQCIPENGIFESEQPAVTAALLACRKSEFESAGMFHEGYNYGYEDVDLCLAYRTELNLAVVLTNKTSAVHDESASQKKDSSKALSIRRRANIELLRQRFGHFLEKQRQISKFRGGLWTTNLFRVGLVITDDDPNTKAGDLFTAMELAAQLESEFGWVCSYLPRLSKTRDWYDVEGLDCIIVLLDNYDLSKVHNASGRIIKIAWLRNWFDRWVAHPWFKNYDLCLCSSEKACEFVQDFSGKQTHLLKIATNADRFNSDQYNTDQYPSDYCFTGSFWNSPRQIEQFDPRNLPYDFALYGVGWENHAQFKDSYKGSLPYTELPAVYAGTKILIDDANHVTKPWGSVNSRVFDALASNVLVITNGDIGASDTFGDLLPTYRTPEELEQKVSFFLNHPEERTALIQKLHRLVVEEHTYKKRAHELKAILEMEAIGRTRVAIKLPVPRIEEINEWGDYHLGKGLAKSLSQLGYAVRLDIIPDWYSKRPIPDDVIITIRGLSRYEPDSRHVNLLWQISHPDKVTHAEYEQYDHVFVASEIYANQLSTRLSTPVSALLQCSDPDRFKFRSDQRRGKDVVFVGNSRKQFRPIVKDAIEAGIDLKVYGTKWEEFIDKKYIAGQHIDNAELGEVYASAGVVLNDHWETMSSNGFISNRLFDAAACGGIVVSDAVTGINELFDGLVYEYSAGSTELGKCIEDALGEDQSFLAKRQALSNKIANEHSFKARADKLNDVIMAFFKQSENESKVI